MRSRLFALGAIAVSIVMVYLAVAALRPEANTSGDQPAEAPTARTDSHADSDGRASRHETTAPEESDTDVLEPPPPPTLVVRHPLLRAADDGGRVVVTGPDHQPELRLVHGPLVRIPAASAQLPPTRGYRASPRVLVFRDGLESAPVLSCIPVVEEGELRFANLAPGTYTFFVDLVRGAPVVLEDVEIGEDTTVLSPIEPAPGLTLRVRVQLPDGGALPRNAAVDVQQRAPDGRGPSYSRRGRRLADEGVIVVEGLLPGPHHVMCMLPSNMAGMHREEIVIGDEPVEIVWDLR